MSAPRPIGGIGFAIKAQLKEDRKYDFSRDTGSDELKHVDVIKTMDTYKPHGRKGCSSEAEVLKRDLENLPDESYSVHPSDIGMALLRGMLPAWQPGDKICSRGLQQPIEYVKRDFRLGLGADPEMPSASRKRRGKAALDPHLVLAEDTEGRRRSYKFLDERLVKRRRLGLHSPVLILAGRHREMLGTVVQWAEGEEDEIYVALDLNRVEVKVAKNDIRLADAEDYRRFGTMSNLPDSLRPPAGEGHPGAAEGKVNPEIAARQPASGPQERDAIPVEDSDGEADGSGAGTTCASHPPFKSSFQARSEGAALREGSVRHVEHRTTQRSAARSSQERPDSGHSRRVGDRPRRDGEGASNGHGNINGRSAAAQHDGGRPPQGDTEELRHNRKAAPAPLSWVLRRLCVRIVSRGPHYTKKGHVYDITDRCRCTVRLEDGALVEGVTEDQLETIVPKQVGQQVMIVRGKYRGRVARLHSRDGTKERCVLQIDTHVESMPFDNVCVFLEDGDRD
eukprot:GGOE01000367.1.p1 GENE.GGOE01000367.1~~GGOE01000367.1.p1  ORF type:complete len:508 (-),score=116.74 GGOE01000367.1:38-1561(-)